jgi:hypothetical protein
MLETFSKFDRLCDQLLTGDDDNDRRPIGLSNPASQPLLLQFQFLNDGQQIGQ